MPKTDKSETKKKKKKRAEEPAPSEGKKKKKPKVAKTTPEEEETNGRKYTVSIALPGSIVANAQSPELRTYLVGQIARVACVFNIDEIVIFCEADKTSTKAEEQVVGEFKGAHRGSDPNVFAARVLQYLETPQYLRRALFPVHHDLKYAGLLNPLDAPHHVRITHNSRFREAVVLNRPVKLNEGSWVNCGLKKEIRIDRTLHPGTRLTVEINKWETSATDKTVTGVAVAPAKPREQYGQYWGYQTRLAKGLTEVWTECPFEGGYDLSVGTSENGVNVHDSDIPKFNHLLIVFGGLAGLESAIAADEGIEAINPGQLFQCYVNACPKQGSRTIRTEEAIPIVLSAMYKYYA